MVGTRRTRGDDGEDDEEKENEDDEDDEEEAEEDGDEGEDNERSSRRRWQLWPFGRGRTPVAARRSASGKRADRPPRHAASADGHDAAARGRSQSMPRGLEPQVTSRCAAGAPLRNGRMQRSNPAGAQTAAHATATGTGRSGRDGLPFSHVANGQAPDPH